VRVLSVLFVCGFAGLTLSMLPVQAEKIQRPNILWLYIEDMNPSLGVETGTQLVLTRWVNLW